MQLTLLQHLFSHATLSGLQLKAEKAVKQHLERWDEYLAKWGDAAPMTPRPHEAAAAGTPHLVLRRDARTLLGDERDLVSGVYVRSQGRPHACPHNSGERVGGVAV